MPIRDCRSCRYMKSIREDYVRCRHYEIENGIVQERLYERPCRECKRYREVKEK